jgi:NADH-ubiquinone oxidoreductase chain 2
MIILYIISKILAIALPSPLLLIRIATIALLYVAALLISVVYIQSIGSGIGIFSGLFCDVQGFNTLLEPTAITLSSLLPVKPASVLTRCRLTNFWHLRCRTPNFSWAVGP